MSETTSETKVSSGEPTAGQELVESWKGIAAHLGRDVRTAQRWEKQEGLPVHRHLHNRLSSVYAYREELDTWWRDRRAELNHDPANGSVEGLSGRRIELRTAVLLAATALLLGVVLTRWLFSPEPAHESPVRRFAFVPEEPVSKAAISPNGKHIAYVTGAGQESQLWVQDLDRIEPRKVTGAVGASEIFDPFWSPDSLSLGFGTEKELRTVSAVRGNPVTICSFPDRTQEYLGGTWSPDGESIAFAQKTTLYKVASRGATPTILAKIDPSAGIEHIEMPHFLPGTGNKLVVTFKEVGKPHAVGVLSAGSGRPETLSPAGLSCGQPIPSNSGHLLYSCSSDDWTYGIINALPFSLARTNPIGEAFPVVRYGSFPSLSTDGTLVYVEDPAAKAPQQLVWKDRNGRKTGILSQPPKATLRFSLSPDKRHMAFCGWPTYEITIYDLAGNREIFLGPHQWQYGDLVWTHDGKWLTFARLRGRKLEIVSHAADRNDEPTILMSGESSNFPTDWSSDGRFLMYTHSTSETIFSGDLRYLRRSESGSGYESVPLIESPHAKGEGKFSPNGRYVAYSSDESGRKEVYVVRFPEGSGKIRVSREGGAHPHWSSDGKELFYIESETLVSIPIASVPDLSPGVPKRLFSDPNLKFSEQFDVSQDGRQFLILEPVGDAPPPVIRVVENWYTEFRQDRQD
ncbi:MAG: hypothetical protein AB1898_32615 [Acidobacteriota bacterium]